MLATKIKDQEKETQKIGSMRLKNKKGINQSQ